MFTMFICVDVVFIVFPFRTSKVLCCQTTPLTGTECCRLRGTRECFCSTHTHDSAGSHSAHARGIKKKIKKNLFFLTRCLQCYCSLMRRNEAAGACGFDPALLLDHSSVAVLQHLLRSVNAWPELAHRQQSPSRMQLRSICTLFVLQLRRGAVPVGSGSAAQTPGQLFTEAQVKRQAVRGVCCFLCFNCSSLMSGSHLVASAHRELPVKGSSQEVAQVRDGC